ncbi:MAG: CRISPR-associated protein Cmr4 [Actinomycetota bacterium]|jgi:CRISPR-associated protein Cmr4|nr:CRISPR-associated protein Cmr4 [Actinomycetota bacterium]
MFAAAECMFLYLESSLRVGSGEERREVDLPIQREAATGYPLLPGSSLKGVLRARARSQQAPAELFGLLGSAPEGEERQPSCVVVSDALPLLFPVRSLTGLFAWATGVEIWSRFRRDLVAYGVKVPELPQPPALAPETAGVAPESPLLGSKGTLVLEELSFPAQVAEEVGAMGTWLAEHAFPDEPAFDYWRRRAAHGVVLLPEGAYRHFVTHGTQVLPRIRIDPRTGTAAEGSLWTEEFLPPETLVYALVGANLPEAPPGFLKKAADLIDWVRGLASGHLQVGSGRTLGHGLVRVRWTGKKVARTRRGSQAKKS